MFGHWGKIPVGNETADQHSFKRPFNSFPVNPFFMPDLGNYRGIGDALFRLGGKDRYGQMLRVRLLHQSAVQRLVHIHEFWLLLEQPGRDNSQIHAVMGGLLMQTRVRCNNLARRYDGYDTSEDGLRVAQSCCYAHYFPPQPTDEPPRVAPRRRLGKVSRAANARGGGTGVAPGPAEDDTKIAPSPWSRRGASTTTVARRECPGADQIPMSRRHAVSLACSRHDPAISCTDHESRSTPVSEARRLARHARDRAPYWL